MYVIQNSETKKYVARFGVERSYTSHLQFAQTYLTRNAAELSACGNERVLSVDDAMYYAEPQRQRRA